jgi:NAD(P)-dependent dehydrogenase (short-subunit alcohol dehydrogenase family)
VDVPPPDLRGRVVVITGATSGIGRATAVALARMGATLALVARDRARADATVAEIAAATGNRDVAVFLADLGAQADIRRVAGELLERYPQIHVLVNNAGVMNLRRRTTVDGVEETFAVNHLGYFLLTLLLLDRLKASAPARIVNVASDAHKFVRGMSWDDLGHEKTYAAMRVYGHSKLANILFTQELARRLEGTGVTANAAHPGAVATRLGHQNAWWAALLAKALGLFFRTPERGAETSIRLASAPELAGVTGRYFANGREARTSTPARDQEAARRLWDVSERMVGLASEPPGW